MLMSLVSGVVAAQYITLTNQIQYRICRQGAGSRVQAGSFVYLRLGGAGKMSAIAGERYWLKIDDEPRQNSLHNALRKLSVGDSAEFVLPYGLILESMVNLQRIKGVQAKEKVTLNVKILRTEGSDIVSSAVYETFCQQQETQSQRYVQQYLKVHPVFEKRKNGIYLRILRQGNSKSFSKTGKAALIAYTGYFLNGTKFDNTPHSGAFRYVRGVQFQMIQGIAMMLAEMNEGMKIQVIIPSKLAFGYKGLADIVPPFAPVVYDLEMIKIE
jgi:FKBP-type peptidyl-prolyl cis-trans isomerase